MCMIASQTSHMRNRHWKIVFASLALCLLAAVAYARQLHDHRIDLRKHLPRRHVVAVYLDRKRYDVSVRFFDVTG